MIGPGNGAGNVKVMEKVNKYAIIGGQYQAYFYGFAPTLHAAKLLAARNVEYWDNWQGWHTPAIYAAADVEPVTNFYGDGYAPKSCAVPVAVKGPHGWETREINEIK